MNKKQIATLDTLVSEIEKRIDDIINIADDITAEELLNDITDYINYMLYQS